MIGKNEQAGDNDNNVDRIKLIANTRASLEANAAQVRKEIKKCFAQLAEALASRERQLLRQAEAVHTQQLSLVQSSLEFLPPSVANISEKDDLEERIRQFGRIELSGSNCITVKDVEPYKVQDYQEAYKDHVTFDKSIIHENDVDTDEKRINESKITMLDAPKDHENAVSNSNSLCNTSSSSRLRDDPSVHRKTLQPSNSPVRLKSTNGLSPSSPLLIIKQKLSLTRLSTENSDELDAKCSKSLKDIIENSTTCTENCNTTYEQNSEENERNDRTSNYNDTDVDETDDLVVLQDASDCTNKECVKSQEVLKDSYEHPKQVQQWLQQILVETEIEPTVHEIGQFSEISDARFYNDCQLET